MEKRTGVAGPLLDKARAGQLSSEDLARVRGQLEHLQRTLADELWEEGEEEVPLASLLTRQSSSLPSSRSSEES